MIRFVPVALDIWHVPKLPPTARYRKRLTDKILVAFHQACDQGDDEIASELIRVPDFMVMRDLPFPAGEGRRIQQGLVAAHERLWELGHSEGGEAGRAAAATSRIVASS